MTDAPSEAVLPRARALRVLIIDDDLAELELITDALESTSPSVKVITATTWEDVQAQFVGGGAALPDLVLLDIQMPRIDGFEVLQRLKSTAHLCAIPVVVRSGSDTGKDVSRAYELRASAFLLKPMTYSDLIAQMRALIGFWAHVRTVL